MHALVFALSLLQAPPQAGPPYRNDTYGFEIAVPPGWVQVPDSVLRERVLAMRRMGAPEGKIDYPAAFARAPVGDWFARPYVLVQVNPSAPDQTAPSSLVQVAADLTGMGQSAHYDPGQDAVLVTSSRIPAQPGTWLRSCSGIRNSRRGLVSVMVYDLEGDSLSTAAIRDRFLTGLRILAPPAPSASPVYRNDTYGFRVAAPDGWVLLPDSILHGMIAMMRQNGASESQTNYVAEFAPLPLHQQLGYPYVLVQIQDIDPDEMPPSLDSLAAILNAMAPEPTGNRLIAKQPESLHARVDSAARAVLLSAGPSQLSDGRLLQSYGALRLVRRGFVSVSAYGLLADSVATAAIRERFLAGFVVDSLPRPLR